MTVSELTVFLLVSWPAAIPMALIVAVRVRPRSLAEVTPPAMSVLGWYRACRVAVPASPAPGTTGRVLVLPAMDLPERGPDRFEAEEAA